MHRRASRLCEERARIFEALHDFTASKQAASRS
jgi:hypothetical protein